MNKLKKLITLGIMLISVCTLIAGCGDEQKTSQTEEKTISVVTHANWKPFEFVDKGNVVGFDVDLINALAEEAGYTCNVSDAGWEAVFQQVKNGSANAAISGITATDERKETFDFSLPYFISKQGILVPADSDITSVEDIKNKNKVVSVQNGSTGQIALEKILGANNPNIKKTALSDQMLLNGQVDAMVGDDTSLNSLVAQHPDKNLKIVYDEKAFQPEYFSIMYAKGENKQVQEDLNNALKTLVNNGKYTEIYKKWFNHEPNIDELKALLK
ncbi:transporter substrate-binding domain-containing protein [Megamonas hypermegale]|uniref:transporter substrate-binding domain-containing protein n=1 Tax=Megamonas hypermegale TaxID=158847 RepID=UPI00255CAD1A|nr:transporter substrate-binding domain-containing protein [Megamonas hypermegale]